MNQTVVVLDPIADATATRLRALLPPGMRLTHATRRDEAHLQSIIADADYAISGQVAVSEPVLRAATKLRLLHKWGVGVDNLDLAAARRLGIKVARTTGSNAVPVAEFTLGLMLAAMRHIAPAAAALQHGQWTGANDGRQTRHLSGKTVGIIGFGAIGQALARLLTGFACPVLYTKRTPLGPVAGAEPVNLPELLARADVVSVNCPLTPETTGLIDRAAFSAMKPTATLVNVARGGVVVEADLIWALRSGVIAGAAMDVFETEPLPPGSPLLGVPGLLLTPHIAALSADTFEPTIRQMFGNILRVSRGETIPERDIVVA